MERIRERCGETGDQLLPMGFAGVAHRALLVHELTHEIRWAFANAWGAARGDGPESRWMIPDQPDPDREETAGLYGPKESDHRVALITGRDGGRRIADGRGHLVPTLVIDPADAAYLPAPQCAGRQAFRRELNKRLRAATRPGRVRTVVLQLRIRSLGDLQLVETVLDWLHRRIDRGRAAVVPLDLETTETAGADDHGGEEPGCEPGALLPLGDAAVAAADNRVAGRRSNAQTDQTLRILGGVTSVAGCEQTARARPGRELLSAMPGDATLAGPGFDISFDAGRFVSLRAAASPERPGEPHVPALGPATTTLCVRSRAVTFEPFSSFSLESELSRGIHGIEQLASPLLAGTASVTTEALVVEDHEALLLNLEAAWPGFAGTGDGRDNAASRTAPAILSLLEWRLPRDGVRISVAYPDRSSRVLQIGAGAPVRTAAGWLLRLGTENGGAVISFWTPGGAPLVADNRVVLDADCCRFGVGGAYSVGPAAARMRFSVLVCPGHREGGIAASIERSRHLPTSIRREVER